MQPTAACMIIGQSSVAWATTCALSMPSAVVCSAQSRDIEAMIDKIEAMHLSGTFQWGATNVPLQYVLVGVHGTLTRECLAYTGPGAVVHCMPST